MVDFLHFLKNTSYPGRGILVGKDRVYYFIMGRSENSRNRVFVKTDDGIRTEAFDPAKLADPSLIQHDFEAAIELLLEQYKIDVIVLAGFLSILSENFTKKWPRRILNIHPSLIPSFCGRGMYGLKVHEAALARGVKVTGATVHFVNEIPDGGEIILQKAVEIEEGDTPETLQRRVMEQAEWKLLPRATELVCRAITEEEN